MKDKEKEKKNLVEAKKILFQEEGFNNGPLFPSNLVADPGTLPGSNQDKT